MRGFIDRNGEYYEADEPLAGADSEVELRPSEMYVVGPDGNWILDRRALSLLNKIKAQHRDQRDIQDFQVSQQNIEDGRRSSGVNKKMVETTIEETTKNAALNFIIKHWVTISSVLVWAFGTYVTVSQKFYEMDIAVNQLTKKVETLSSEHREQAKLFENKLQNLEGRYNDLNLFLQQLASKNKG